MNKCNNKVHQAHGSEYITVFTFANSGYHRVLVSFTHQYHQSSFSSMHPITKSSMKQASQSSIDHLTNSPMDQSIKMPKKCFTNDLHVALLRKSNSDFLKSWRSKFWKNANHNTRHIFGLIKAADISANSQAISLIHAAQTIWHDELNEQYLNMRSTYTGYPL